MMGKYERMGRIVTYIERSALVTSLREKGPLSVAALQEDAERRLGLVGKDISLSKSVKAHLEALEKDGMIQNSDGQYRLTTEGAATLEEFA